MPCRCKAASDTRLGHHGNDHAASLRVRVRGRSPKGRFAAGSVLKPAVYVDLSDGRRLSVSRKNDDRRVCLGRPDDPGPTTTNPAGSTAADLVDRSFASRLNGSRGRSARQPNLGQTRALSQVMTLGA